MYIFQYNDIAIIRLDSPVEFTKQVRPVCLPTGSSTYAGKTATVIGWGSLSEGTIPVLQLWRLLIVRYIFLGGHPPSVLQEVNIPIWTNSNCRLKYGGAAPGGIVDHMLCAGEASRDSCSVSKLIWKKSVLKQIL